MNGEIRNPELYLSNTNHYHVWGNVYGSDKFYDGLNITTSRILEVRMEEFGLVVTTKNSEYFLPYEYMTVESMSEFFKMGVKDCI